MDQLVIELVSGPEGVDNSELLNRIAVSLRDPRNRENTTLRQHCLNIVCNFNKLFTTDVPIRDTQLSNFMKLWVNFVADNDENRLLLLSLDKEVIQQFHHNLQKTLTSGESDWIYLIIIFLRNLSFANDETILTLVQELKYFETVVEYLIHLEPIAKNLEPFINASDLVREYNWTPIVSLDRLIKYVELVRKFVNIEQHDEEDGDDDDDDHFIVICTEVIAKLSKSDAFEYGQSYPQQIISNLCEDIGGIYHGKVAKKLQRNLFDSMGQISSDDKNTNGHELVFNIGVIEMDDRYHDPYVIVSSLITMGNFINSLDDKHRLLVLFKDVNRFVQIAWTKFVKSVIDKDVVLLQGIHFFQQIWHLELSIVIFNNWASFIKVSDAFYERDVTTYYQQISVLMCKFVSKFIASLDTVRQDEILNGARFELFEHIISVLNIWQSDLSNSKIKFLLETTVFTFIVQISLHKVVVSNTDNLTQLICVLLQLNEQSQGGDIPFEYVFEKLKLIAMLLESDDNCKLLLLQNKNLAPVLENMMEVVSFAKSQVTSSPHTTLSALENNLKFIGAKLQGIVDDDDEELQRVSSMLVRL